MSKQIQRDKKLRILKSMLYKYDMPINSVFQNPRHDNFIAYSIVNKISNSGWFSNERFLVLDCANKQLFYLKNVPQTVIDQTKPFQIYRLNESKQIKKRINLNSYAKQLKNVTRNENVLTIEFRDAIGQMSHGQDKVWIIELTSNQMAKDWMSLINLIQKGTLNNASQYKKTSVTPQVYPLLKPSNKNLTQTPKSLTQIQSLQMKSDIVKINGQTKQHDQNKQKYMTPTTRQDGNNNEKFFRKSTNQLKQQQGTTNPNLNSPSIQIHSPSPLQSQHQQSMFLNSQDAITLEDLNQDFQRSCQNTSNFNNSNKRFNPLSQQLEDPLGQQGHLYQSDRGSKRINQKYNVKVSEIIHEENQEDDNNNDARIVLSEELGLDYPYDSRTLSQMKKGGLIKSNISSQLPDRKRQYIKPSFLTQNLSKNLLDTPAHFNRYNNTYNSRINSNQQLPTLHSTYDWNGVYFSLLLDYYNYLTDYTSRASSLELQLKEQALVQDKLFDMVWAIERHVSKFQLYCAKAVETIVNQFILKQQGKTSTNSSKITKIKDQFIPQTENTNLQQQVKQLEELLDRSQSQHQQQTPNNFSYHQKRVQFQYQGISLVFFINMSKPTDSTQISSHHHDIMTRYSALFKINHLHSYFTQPNPHVGLSYFHILTPLCSIISLHGIDFYCRALFKPQLQTKYKLVSLNETDKYSNRQLQRYLKERITCSKLNCYSQHNITKDINSIYYYKQLDRHNRLVIDLSSIDQGYPSKLKTPTYFEHNYTLPQLFEFSSQYLYILEVLQQNFSKQGGCNLTTHEDFKQLMQLASAQPILTCLQQLLHFYSFARYQAYENTQLFKSNPDFKILSNRQFLCYLLKQLQNELVSLKIVSQLNNQTENFILELSKQIQIRKHLSRQSMNQQIQIQLKTLSLGSHSSKAQRKILIFDYQKIDSNQLNQLIIKNILQPSLNEVFSRQKQQSLNILIKDDDISLKLQALSQIVSSFPQQISKYFQHSSLDNNYIYQAVLSELNLQTHFDPLSPHKQSLEKVSKMLRSPKEQLQRLIRSPFSSPQKTVTNQLFVNKNNNKIFLFGDSQNFNPNPNIKTNNFIEIIPKLTNNQDRKQFLCYPNKITKSFKYNYPVCDILQQPKLKCDLKRIKQLIDKKEFNKAVEIYYLATNANHKSSKVFYQYFKSLRSDNVHSQTSTVKPSVTVTKPKSEDFNLQTHLTPTPSLLTYVLASQSVAFSFFSLLHTLPKTGTFSRKIQIDQQQKQYKSLTLKYTEMSHFGSQILFGQEHVIYMVNQLMLAMLKLKDSKMTESRQHFQNAQKTIQLNKVEFIYKQLSLPVLYFNAYMNLKCGYYRAAIHSIRMLMEIIEVLKDHSSSKNDSKKYWLQDDLCKVLQSQIPQFTQNQIHQSYTYLSFQLLYYCNQTDPRSKVNSNRRSIKLDLMESLKQASNFDLRYVKTLKLLWNLETKLMSLQSKNLIKDVISKLYTTVIKQMRRQRLIKDVDIGKILNPLGKHTTTLTYLLAEHLFLKIFQKPAKYFNFLLHQFHQSQFTDFINFLQNNMEKTSEQLEHYDLKQQLFKHIVLVLKFIIMLGYEFIIETLMAT